MPYPTAPLPPPEEKPGKLEGISKKLIPIAVLFLLLLLGYHFSLSFIKMEIKVREIESDRGRKGETSPVVPNSLPRTQNNNESVEGIHSTPPSNFSENGASPKQISVVNNNNIYGITPTPSLIPFHKKINLNTAKADDFTNLPGLGVKKSLAIIEYRRNNGPFKATEDIMKVKGIGKKLYEKIKPWIYVE